VLMEAQAAPGLPVWFREGLAERLALPAGTAGAAEFPADSALRQAGDAAEARRAYAEARAAVARLVERYGEATVLGWVRRGVPPEAQAK